MTLFYYGTLIVVVDAVKVDDDKYVPLSTSAFLLWKALEKKYDYTLPFVRSLNCSNIHYGNHLVNFSTIDLELQVIIFQPFLQLKEQILRKFQSGLSVKEMFYSNNYQITQINQFL